MRAWDVVWGHADRAPVDRERLRGHLEGGVVTRGPSSIAADGPLLARLPAQGRRRGDQRAVRAHGPADARPAPRVPARRLAGRRQGVGRVPPLRQVHAPVRLRAACSSPTPRRGASRSIAPRSPMRFEGKGVRLDGRGRSSKGGRARSPARRTSGGTARYSFDASGERIPLETVALDQVRPGGVVGPDALLGRRAPRRSRTRATRCRWAPRTCSSASSRSAPSRSRLDVQDRLVMIEQLEAAALGVSGSGQIEMSANTDAELSFRFNRTLLDPYVRLFVPQALALHAGGGQRHGRDRRPARQLGSAVRERDGGGPPAQAVRLRAAERRADAADVREQRRARGPGLGKRAPRHTAGARRRRADAPPAQRQPRHRARRCRATSTSRTERIDVNVDGKANLAVLQVFFRDLRSSGDAVLHGSITGSLSQPLFSGYAQITDGRIRHMSLPQSIQAINGRVAFGADGHQARQRHRADRRRQGAPSAGASRSTASRSARSS